ncbi:MAG TPA: hypothetical protein DIT25_03450 [Candidatus Moranbacteria bacterium]|nr:hypothetical protein [Candidatus Moranbacteria bacterium]
MEKFLYNKVAVIDDNRDVAEFMPMLLGSKGAAEFFSKCTRNKEEALQFILEHNPDAIILDMHLTDDEEYDGIWIANQLSKNSFSGKVMIHSGSGHLSEMRKLIRLSDVHIPGKDFDAVVRCLFGTCNCTG